MNVLVTGGAGFVGAYVVRELLQSGDVVVVYDRLPSGNALDFILGATVQHPFVAVAGEIANGDRLSRVMQEHAIEAVVHLASPLGAVTEGDPPLAVRDMIDGQLAVLAASRAANVKKVVWASSVGVYGGPERYPVRPLPNDAPHYPLTLYGACKSFNERLAEHYTTTFGLETIGLRFPLVYGVGRQRGNAMHSNELIEKPALGIPCRIERGDMEYVWLYVLDAARLVSQALRCGPTSSRSFNVCSEVGAMRRAVAIVQSWFPEASIDVDPGGDSIVAEYDCAALNQEVGFSPAWSLRDGLRDSVNIVRARAGLSLVA
jgi:UDP-glucose 4-epimerase